MQGESDDEIIVEDESEGGEGAVAKLRERLKKAVAEKQEYLDGWQRARADFLNEKKVSDERYRSALEFAQAQAAEKLIPLVDAFDLAFAAPTWVGLDASYRTGIERLRDDVLKALKDLGVEGFSPLGLAFDPASMSAVREVDGEGTPGTVASVDRQGFKMGETVIRPAYVSLYK